MFSPLLILYTLLFDFKVLSFTRSLSSRYQLLLANNIKKTSLFGNLKIVQDENTVGYELCNILRSEYKNCIDAKGSFNFGISGGSMIKMLSNLNGESEIDFSKCTMIFVSHRCVPLDDDGATYHKAIPAFLKSWIDQGLKVLAVSGSNDSILEASLYEKSIENISSKELSRTKDGYPEFDLLLIGIGLDGHVGSIYPNLIDDVNSKRIVVPATSKNGKISLSLKTMLASKVTVVACAGKSSKAPLGKAEAMVRALENESESPLTFPASALRDKALWLIDEDSSVLLKNRYI